MFEGRGVEIVNFLLVQGQVKSQNVLVHRKFYLSERKKKKAYTFQSLSKLLFQTQYETRYISTLVNSMDPDQLASLENCSSRSAGFGRSQLIRIHTVFIARCELVILKLIKI